MSQEKIVARPYAKALFELAKESNTFDVWSRMLLVAKQVVEDPRFFAAMQDPRIPASWLVETLVSVDSQLFTKEAISFLNLLGSLKRWAILPAVLDFFEAYKANALALCPVHVTVAYALTAEQESALAEAISQHVEKQLVLTYETDVSILGGAVIRIGDQLIDGSVRGRLVNLAEALLVAV